MVGAVSAGGRWGVVPDEERDANPLFDRLPTEVIKRKPKLDRSEPQQSEKAIASTDIQAVLSKGSGTREKWLKKALQQLEEELLEAQEIFDIITHPEFCLGLKEQVGRNIFKAICSKIKLFPKKQQRFLTNESVLAELYGAKKEDPSKKDKDKEKEDAEKAKAAAAEEMMARCRDFMRGMQGLQTAGGPDGQSMQLPDDPSQLSAMLAASDSSLTPLDAAALSGAAAAAIAGADVANPLVGLPRPDQDAISAITASAAFASAAVPAQPMTRLEERGTRIEDDRPLTKVPKISAIDDAHPLTTVPKISAMADPVETPEVKATEIPKASEPKAVASKVPASKASASKASASSRSESRSRSRESSSESKPKRKNKAERKEKDANDKKVRGRKDAKNGKDDKERKESKDVKVGKDGKERAARSKSRGKQRRDSRSRGKDASRGGGKRRRNSQSESRGRNSKSRSREATRRGSKKRKRSETRSASREANRRGSTAKSGKSRRSGRS